MPPPRLRAPARALLAPLLALLCTGACATAFTSSPPRLRIHSDPPGAEVRDSAGRLLGTTPWTAKLRARQSQSFTVSTPGYQAEVVYVGRRLQEDVLVFNVVNPLAWAVDVGSGALYAHDPGTLTVALTPVPVPPPDSLPNEVMALAFSEFAAVAEAAGCEPLLVDGWRDAARAFGDSAAAAVPDSVRRMVAAEARRVAAEARSLCARPSARMERLREIRESLARSPAPAPDARLFAPVYFGVDEWEVADDSVRDRLRALARRLADERLPVRLVVEGFSDPQGTETRNRELGFARAGAVIHELRRAGLPADCCVAASHGADPERQVVPGAAGSAPGARWNRRVTFTLDYLAGP